jgi:ElaB/YqjD/DUF883 family membrane-anchored ribosome-binding protein
VGSSNGFGDVAMMVARNGSYAQKKDLHFGGLGDGADLKDVQPRVAIAVATRLDALGAAAREAARSANHILRGNPWAALGLGAALGLTAGYLLSRKDARRIL